ncbi:MAG: class I SAM-dependent methyltransferase [Bryobacterales bacterium]|nr:class I SAM-dependent methyltransferase [Bryobacteraceae bacterium]MDW8354578.1 class I SAM-dependent methyltransferase [Bryobacterales bacterium]
MRRFRIPALLRLLFVATTFPASELAVGQSVSPAPQAQGHAQHLHREFDPKRDLARLEDPRREQWQKPDEVIQRLNLRPGMKIADIGAGTGYFAVRLARHQTAPIVYAVDIAPEMVKFLRERAAKENLTDRLRIVQGGQTSPNLPEAVDLVLVVNTYHHIADRVAYFRDLASSLRPEARVAIVDWKKDAPMGPPVHHRFPPEQIHSEMTRAGYRLVEQHDFLPHQHFLVFTRIPGPEVDARRFWNEAYSRPNPPLAGPPSAILVEAVRGLRPGKALDFGMGLGRNALWLASQGWEVTGVDISDVAVEKVKKAAAERQLNVEAVLADLREYDLGEEKWDLIVAANMHDLTVENAPRLIAALKPGGLLVVEGFHADVRTATNFRASVGIPPGHPTNQLVRVFDGLRILRYEDTMNVRERQDRAPQTFSRVHLIAYKETAPAH